MAYRHVGADGKMGSIQKLSNVLSTNGNIMESKNGDVWITWENWDVTEQAFAARFANATGSWTVYNVSQFQYKPKVL